MCSVRWCQTFWLYICSNYFTYTAEKSFDSSFTHKSLTIGQKVLWNYNHNTKQKQRGILVCKWGWRGGWRRTMTQRRGEGDQLVFLFLCFQEVSKLIPSVSTGHFYKSIWFVSTFLFGLILAARGGNRESFNYGCVCVGLFFFPLPPDRISEQKWTKVDPLRSSGYSIRGKWGESTRIIQRESNLRQTSERGETGLCSEPSNTTC